MLSPEPARDSGRRTRTGTQIASRHGRLWLGPLPCRHQEVHPQGTCSQAPSLPAPGTCPRVPRWPQGAGERTQASSLKPQTPSPSRQPAPEHTGKGPWGASPGMRCQPGQLGLRLRREPSGSETPPHRCHSAPGNCREMHSPAQTNRTIPALSTDSPGFRVGGRRPRTRHPRVQGHHGPLRSHFGEREGLGWKLGGRGRAARWRRGAWYAAGLSLSLFCKESIFFHRLPCPWQFSMTCVPQRPSLPPAGVGRDPDPVPGGRRGKPTPPPALAIPAGNPCPDTDHSPPTPTSREPVSGALTTHPTPVLRLNVRPPPIHAVPSLCP